jgi:hypothetical protein
MPLHTGGVVGCELQVNSLLGRAPVDAHHAQVRSVLEALSRALDDDALHDDTGAEREWRRPSFGLSGWWSASAREV